MVRQRTKDICICTYAHVCLFVCMCVYVCVCVVPRERKSKSRIKNNKTKRYIYMYVCMRCFTISSRDLYCSKEDNLRINSSTFYLDLLNIFFTNRQVSKHVPS